MESDADTLCVICNSQTPGLEKSSRDYFHPLNPKLLSKDLGSYFLLRHIFNLSSEQIQNYLRHCPHPGDWVKVCSECTENYVDKCTRIFLELLEVKRSFREAKREVIEAVQRSMSVRNTRKPPIDPYTLNIAEEVRRFVSKCKPETEPDHAGGDAQATKWMALLRQSKISREDGLLSSVVTKSDDANCNVHPGPGVVIKLEYEEDFNDREGGIDADTDVFGGRDTAMEDESTQSKFENAYHDEGGVSRPYRNRDDSDSDSSGGSSEPDEPMIVLPTRKKTPKLLKATLPPRPTEPTCNALKKTDSDPLAEEPPSPALLESKVQKCELCNKRAPVKELKNHLIRFHKRTEIITCPRCPLVFATRAYMVEHLNVHRRLGFFCDLCGKEETFRNHRALRNHYETAHQVDFAHLTCKFCGKTMTTRDGLGVHIKREHTEPDGSDGDTKTANKKAREKYSRTKYTCDLCMESSVEYCNKNALNTHKVRVHGFEPSFPCKTCGKRFSSLAVLTSHEKSEHLDVKDRPCPAPGCGKVFHTELKLKVHLRYSHEDKDKHVCPDCGNSYPTAYQLKNHQNSKHLGIRPYACDICGSAFVKVAYLNRHKLIHTGK